MERLQEHHACPVPLRLRPFVEAVHGYRLAGFDPGVHVGLPGTALTLVVPLDEQIRVADGASPEAYGAMVGGMLDRPVEIHHDGSSYGIQVDLTPAGSRALLGLPAAEVGAAVDLESLATGSGRRLAEQAAGQPDWCGRIRVVLDALTARLHNAGDPRPEVGHAWAEIRRTGGTVPVWAVAADVGWSIRHLQQQFRAEYGLSPKTAARVTRFQRARDLLGRGVGLAEAAVTAGYADQAHLNRDWLGFVGLSPTRWRTEDQLAFVQDRDVGEQRG